MKYYFWFRNGILKVVGSSAQPSRSHRPEKDTDDLSLPHPVQLLLSVIDIGEGLCRLRDPQELARWPPALLDLKHQQPVSRDLSLDLGIPIIKESHSRLLARVNDTKQSPGVSGAQVCGGPAREVCGHHGLPSDPLQQPEVITFY